MNVHAYLCMSGMGMVWYGLVYIYIHNKLFYPSQCHVQGEAPMSDGEVYSTHGFRKFGVPKMVLNMVRYQHGSPGWSTMPWSYDVVCQSSITILYINHMPMI